MLERDIELSLDGKLGSELIGVGACRGLHDMKAANKASTEDQCMRMK
jgi:hypothetical protein